MSIFKVPVGVINKLEALRSNFFWGSDGDSHKIQWDNVHASFDKRGLNVGSLTTFYNALLKKWRWRFLHDVNGIWRKVIQSIHGQSGGFVVGGSKTGDVGVWSRVVSIILKMYNSNIVPLDTIERRLGKGDTIQFWEDIWLGNQPFKSRFNRLFQLELNQDCWVKDRWEQNQWVWNWRRVVCGG